MVPMSHSMRIWSYEGFVKCENFPRACLDLALFRSLGNDLVVTRTLQLSFRGPCTPSERRDGRRLRRKVFLSLRLVITLLLLPGCAEPERVARSIDQNFERPNILLLVAEDMSPRVGVFGDPVALTPRLDALAGEGTRFPNSFATAGVCAPSRAAQITGLHQNVLGAGHMRTSSYSEGGYAAVPPGWVKAYPEILRAAGYYTFNWGKTDYQLASRMWADDSPRTIWDANRMFGATDWTSVPTDKPFFGMINFHSTHESALFPKIFWPENLTHAIVLLGNLIGRTTPEAVTDPQQVDLPPFYPETASARATVARQYDNIHLMDQQVGAVLDQLARDGLATSTIVIWTTDHGSGLPGAKRELSDAGIRVPMIIRWPRRFRPAGVEPGQVEERMVSFVDLAPTILSMAGVPIPEWMVGQIFTGSDAAPPREFVFAARDRIDEFPDRSRAVRSNRYKFIRNWYPDKPAAFDLAFRRGIPLMGEWRQAFEAGTLNKVQAKFFEPRGSEELYDLSVDPWETRNLAKDPRYTDARKEMSGALERWLTTTDDLGMLPETQLVERFAPDGEPSVTAPPQLDLVLATDGWQATVTHADPHASLEIRRSGGAHPDKWELYRGPIVIEEGETLTAFAVRYGWLESVAVEKTANSNNP